MPEVLVSEWRGVMVSFEFHPNEGVGPIRFGMKSEEVIRVLNSPFESFRKGANADMPTYAFFDDSMHVCFGPSGECNAVELYRPAQLLLDGVDVLAMSFQAIFRVMRKYDSGVEPEDDGAIAYAIGLAVSADPIDASEELVESLLAFTPGYYD